MSDPMPLTTRIITVDSGSSLRDSGTWKSPDVIQSNAETVSSWRATAASETTNENTMAPHATRPAARLLIRRPSDALIRNPAKGRKGIRSSIVLPPLRAFVLSWPSSVRLRWGSPFQARKRIGIQRRLVTKQSDDDGEADGGFR